MLLRLLFLLSFLGYTTGPDYREEEDKLGGRGFGGVVMVVTIIGAIVLIGLIVLAIMAITGSFESDLMDPVV